MKIEGLGKTNTVNLQPDLNSVGSIIKFMEGYNPGIPSNNIVTLGKKCRISNLRVHVYGHNHRVIFGDNVTLLDTLITIRGDRNTFQMGNESLAGNQLRVIMHSGEGLKISIGKRCKFSRNLELRSDDGHSIRDLDTDKIINPPKSIKVGNHVWIGESVILLKGSQIKDNTIIGAYSVVTAREFPENVVLAGNPAKIIRSNITWS